MSFGEVILNYGDYLVRQSEVDILKGNQWLNDTIIGFYFEYLTNSLDNPKVKFYGPEIAQCIKLSSKDDVPIFLGEVDLNVVNWMFWPVNNSNNPESHSGGSHWSLLVYSSPENTFFHFDTSSVMNEYEAEALFKNISPSVSTNTPPKLEAYSACLKQSNGIDCGLHVLANANKIAQYVLQNGHVISTPTATPQEAQSMRKSTLQLIGKLKSEQ